MIAPEEKEEALSTTQFLAKEPSENYPEKSVDDSSSEVAARRATLVTLHGHSPCGRPMRNPSLGLMKEATPRKHELQGFGE